MGYSFNPFTGNLDTVGLEAWQLDAVGLRRYVSPKTESDVLYIGDRDAASAIESSFAQATAVFVGSQTSGTNYFINPGYGTSFIPFGGLFAAGRARGTHASPTDVQDGDWLGGFTAVAYLNGGWVDGSTFALPGMYMSQLDHSGSDFGTRLYLGSALFEGLTVDMPITGTPQSTVYINRPNADVDFQVNWDGGTSIFSEGSTGNIGIGTASPSARLHINGTANDQQLIVRGHSTQTANLQEWQNSSGTVLSNFTSGGALRVFSTGDSFGSPQAIIQSSGTTGFGLRVNNSSGDGFLFSNTSTTAILQALTSTAAARDMTLSGSSLILRTGSVYTNRLTINNNGNVLVNGFTSSTVGLTVKGAASQTANLQDWQDSSGTVLTAIDASGKLLFSTDTNLYRSAADTLKTDDKLVVSDKFNQISAANNAFGSATGLTGVQLSVLTTSASRVGLTIQGHTSQTANLQDWQNSSANILASLTADGKLTFGTTGDTNLYRSAADILKTDDSLVVGTDLEIDGALDHDGTTAGLYGVTPVTRATTGIAEATFTENAGGTAVNVDSTFGGYTLQQVVQALQDIGILT